MTVIEEQNIIKFPVEQQEQARQNSAESLLARPVYEHIADLIGRSLQRATLVKVEEDENARMGDGSTELDDHRQHDAILIDGGRGTGKSSVLVNLDLYLDSDLYKNRDASIPDILEKLLILKPVDPTLMENSEDLLLNIIIAALLRNKTVKDGLAGDNDKAEAFYQQLQNLSSALKGIQTRKESYGMDRLRSFIGNHGLAEEIHKLFKAVLDLTQKKLIILPIDDVDTSLEYAFANIEVIRKYLGSPYVLPLVSGDLSLYDEVIWRNFYLRLVDAEHSVERKEGLIKAKKLGLDYQQKVLPPPRRISMPSVRDYLTNPHIWLTDQDDHQILRLKYYHDWLQAVINQQVNGIENSRLKLPIFSTRDLAQLINVTHDQVAASDFASLEGDELYCQQLTIMPQNIAHTTADFSQQYNTAAQMSDPQSRRKTRKSAYQELEQALAELEPSLQSVKQREQMLLSWNQGLGNYVYHKPEGGAVYLVTQANSAWLKRSLGIEQPQWIRSVLKLPLFDPLDIGLSDRFELNHGVNPQWLQHQEQQDVDTFERLPSHTLVEFPVPEAGRPMGSVFRRLIDTKAYGDSQSQQAHELALDHLELVRQIMTFRSYYKAGKESNLVFIGRLFELLILSLVSETNRLDIQAVLDKMPFYSFASFYRSDLANSESIDSFAQDQELEENQEELLDLSIITGKINQWRQEHAVQAPSAWLIHQVMKKVFNQLSFINPTDAESKGSFQKMVTIAYRAFNCMLSACGSFEKSDIFGLGQRVAQQSINPDPEKFTYTDLFNLNVRPFTELPEGLGSVTRALYHHPLRAIIELLHQQLKDGTITEPQAESKPKAALQVKAESKQPKSLSFERLTQKYGEEKLKEYAVQAGLIFYTTFRHFRGRGITHELIRRLESKDFAQEFNINTLRERFIKEGLPADFVDDLLDNPKRFLSGKISYRKLVTFINRWNEIDKK